MSNTPQISINPRKSVKLRTNTSDECVKLRNKNPNLWPDSGRVTYPNLLELGFKKGQIQQWVKRGHLVNLCLGYMIEYREYDIATLKQFLIKRVHAGPGSVNKKV